MARAG